MRFRLSVALLLAAFSLPLSAALITDPAGDFLPSFSGPQNGDLDVLSAQVFFTGSSFVFTSTQNGLVGTTPTGLYVWGIDRGAGTAGFPTLAPGVTFDSLFIINPSGASTVRDNVNNVVTPITNITVSGATVTGTVPLSALPSLGLLAPTDYRVNLWPRSGAGGNNVISDFAPDNSVAAVTSATPEPGTISLVGTVGVLGLAMLRRKKA
jgi:hypothetical protein